MSARPRSSLDPRLPLVLDTRGLGRRPGSLRRATLRVPAPAQLGNPLVEVPEGAEIALELRLESAMEGVLVTAELSAPLHGECGRCLEEFDAELSVEFQELYVYADRLEGQAGSPDPDTLPVDGDLLDLEPPLRDAVVLALPQNPVCEPDCLGLDLNGEKRTEPAATPAPLDLRWAALASLQDGPAGATG